MERITKKDVERVFEAFCQQNGLPLRDPSWTVEEMTANEWWGLDVYNPGGGRRYCIVRTAPGTLGESEPFGARRRTTKDMYSVLQFAVQVPGILQDVERWREREADPILDALCRGDWGSAHGLLTARST